MKVTNWRRKLMASLVAGGMLAPSALNAANLDTNLAVDPGFENVDTGTTCCYNNFAVKLNSWNQGTITGFAYNYGLGFDDGGPLAGGGTFFFGAGGTNSTTSPPPITSPGEVAQNIDVSTGATATQIASGEAAVVLSGFFTAYNNQGLRGSLHVDFLNSGGTSLGSTVIKSDPPTPWHEERGAALVPVGTATLRASVFGDGYNAYIDNVDVRVTNATNELMYLEVNTTNGQVAIKNQTGDPINIEYYKIESATGALNTAGWNSLQDQNLTGFPAGNGSGNGWEQFGNSSASRIGEAYLTGTSQVSNNGTIGLGAAFNVGGAHNLVFTYGTVAGPVVNPAGDFNSDGVVDAADYVFWRKNDGSPGGFTTWRANFGKTGGATGASALQGGFVRYVTSGVGTGGTVPEPSSVLLVGIGLASLVVGSSRKTQRDVDA
jgi:PEP-CTERM motif